MIEAFILGAIQGIAEWIPISSEGMVVLAQTQLFGESSVVDAIRLSLFLHLGTFFAALIYFWPTVKRLTTSIFKSREITETQKQETWFYVIATIVSGVTGLILFKLFGEIDSFALTGKTVMFIIGLLLLVTALLQLTKKSIGTRRVTQATTNDSIITGMAQGLAVLPGISRSGSTIGVLLLRKFSEADTLRMSFILSLPIVLLGNIVLNLNTLFLTTENIVGLLTAFVFGILTIHILMRIARKINFGWFVFSFAILTILAAFI